MSQLFVFFIEQSLELLVLAIKSIELVDLFGLFSLSLFAKSVSEKISLKFFE